MTVTRLLKGVKNKSLNIIKRLIFLMTAVTSADSLVNDFLQTELCLKQSHRSALPSSSQITE